MVAKFLPLYYFIDVCRMLTTGHFTEDLWVALPYIVIVPLLLGAAAVKSMKAKLIH
jgi:hypothetical protein